MGRVLPLFGTVFFALWLGAGTIEEVSAEPKKESSIAGLDSAHVKKLYMDGDFDEAILLLENRMKEGEGLNHQDSVFIFKHLGVMYAAKYETRELGKMYMYKLLMVEPTARIMDMYASDMIYMIFKNIQDELESTRFKLVNAKRNLNGNLQSGSVEGDRPTKTRQGGLPVLAWVGASAALVAVGVVAYVILQQDEGQKPIRADF